MQNNSFSFNIDTFTSWSYLADKEYLRELKLSKMSSRRMTKLAKKVVNEALHQIEGVDIDFIVYSSRHGELLLSSELIESIQSLETPSPIKFSQSTHNAASGHLCIQAKRKIPISSISACEESFSMGIVSAVNFLKQNQDSKVLFIYGDAPFPELFKEKISCTDDEIIQTMILSNGEEYQLNLKTNKEIFSESECSRFTSWWKTKEHPLDFKIGSLCLS